ncbi:MAG: ABC transporter permease [Geminocystis sp.]|nr:ABC transporter permease [Geminocystis sp.]MCS7148558.1 ABC transporter permease [Geminocystis sp.]MDW8114869.1 ABC transporter permease subunit [Geminocystis sp.]MDW8464135.1 ABC transporter permease subunit [Geminocystis sp.]
MRYSLLQAKIITANVVAIIQKEIQGYLVSPLAFVVAAVFWLISGMYFFLLLFGEGGVLQSVAFQEQLGNTEPVDVVYEFMQIFFNFLASLTMFVLPILSMGLYAEERKRGTIELLATSPVFNWVVALGKFFGVLLFFVTMIIPILVYEIIIFPSASPPLSLGVPLLAHLGLILFAGSILSLGMFISSLTESTVWAAILTFVLVLILSILDALANNIGNDFGELLASFSLMKNYENLVRGVFDTSNLVLFLSYIILGIFLTCQSLELLRYK